MTGTLLDRIPPDGRTLVRGPSNVGKTRLTAAALDRHLELHGPRNVAVLEFAPEIRVDDRMIGGRLDRFVDVPGTVWVGKIDARAPRLESETEAEVLALAAQNAAAAERVMAAMPDRPRALFVNDATIPFQHPASNPARWLARWKDAETAVCNGFQGTELGEGTIGTRERLVQNLLEAWATTVLELG